MHTIYSMYMRILSFWYGEKKSVAPFAIVSFYKKQLQEIYIYIYIHDLYQFYQQSHYSMTMNYNRMFINKLK